jgi:hypothetical protein
VGHNIGLDRSNAVGLLEIGDVFVDLGQDDATGEREP